MDEGLSELGQAALAYAVERGWYVFPIVPKRKKPALISDYYTLSSRDPDQIKAWWQATPQANIGLDCFKSGIVAVDVDSEAGHGKSHTGMGANLAGLMLVSGGKKAWDTLKSITPTGGEHYIFLAAPEDAGTIKSGSRNFGVPGIDVRAKGGYIVLPPSRVSADGREGKYEFVDRYRPILPLPRKLLSPPGLDKDSDGKTELEQTLENAEKIGQGGRDNFLFKIASKLRGLGFNREEILATIRESYRTRCEDGDSPFTESDFQRIADSAAKQKATLNTIVKLEAATKDEPEGKWHDKDDATAIPATSFIVNYTEPTKWVVDGIFQASSLNMFMGPPKAGKSTLQRHLALCAAYGLPFLGRWKTERTRVLYYSLQENKPHLRKYLLNALWGSGVCEYGEIPDEIPIDFIFRIGHRGERAIAGTLERVKSEGYGLVIIDMWGRYAGVESFDDYAENETVTDAINGVAQSTGSCIIWSHHEKKSGGGHDSFSGAIGSQSIRGAVYTTLRNWKDSGRYYISTEQRDGDDIPPICITRDPKTEVLRTAGTGLAVAMSDEILREKKIREELEHDPTLSVREMADRVGGRQRDVSRMMDRIKKEQEAE